jgi:hypothetical protein
MSAFGGGLRQDRSPDRLLVETVSATLPVGPFLVLRRVLRHVILADVTTRKSRLLVEWALVVVGVVVWVLLLVWSHPAAFVFLFAWIGGWAVYRERRKRRAG